MKNLCFIFVIVISFISCKKENISPKKNEKLNVIFFGVKNNLLNTLSKALPEDTKTVGEPITSLQYTLFDSNKKILTNLIRNPILDSNFNKFSDSIPNGQYRAVFVGTSISNMVDPINYDTSLDYQIKYNREFDDYYNPNPIHLYRGWGDLFYKYISFRINRKQIDTTVTLSRLVSQIQVKIEDLPPKTVENVFVTFLDSTSSFSLFSGKKNKNGDTPLTMCKYITDGDSESKIPTLFAYTANEGTFPLTISAKDVDENVLYEKKLNVTCVRNKRTIVSGKLFSSSSNGEQSFNLQLAPIKETPVITHF